MKESLLIVLAIIIIFSAIGCEKTSTETQTSEQPSKVLIEQTATSTIAPAIVPTAMPTLVQTTTPTQTPKYAFVGEVMCTADEFVNIRENAGTDSEIIGTFPSGETADVIEYLGDWAHISYGGVVGYVSRGYTISLCIPSVAVPMGDWAKILVNPTNLLPDEFTVSLADFEGGQVDERILEISEQMFADAKNDGVIFRLVDAYRSYETQSEQFESMVQRYLDKGYNRADAEVKAAAITARTNTSEHQTGLALDIVTPSYTKRNSGFAETDAFKWLDTNAHNYGFTLRYKLGKEEITKVIYESWHWRFVGVQAAAAMKESGECYEEYLKGS